MTIEPNPTPCSFFGKGTQAQAIWIHQSSTTLRRESRKAHNHPLQPHQEPIRSRLDHTKYLKSFMKIFVIHDPPLPRTTTLPHPNSIRRPAHGTPPRAPTRTVRVGHN
ncbi:hypothetical protein L484_004296 [Morus notabilis]|uniref:Uncharacterized protein n=1 Tax=Morus notabilis TaxID=981085 RepID=W9RQ62_9ROSA|nr:hypothetical protein L484_004296 [Morus notabilis]